MTIPSQPEMYSLTLRYMADGKTRKRKDIRPGVMDSLNLPPEDLAQVTSTNKPKGESRVGWAISYLSRAQLLESPERGVFRISPAGLELIKQNLTPKEFAAQMNARIKKLNPWKTGSKTQEKDTSQESLFNSAEPDVSPQEAIDAAMKSLNEALADELLENILDKPSGFFEKLVVDLMVAMGYGTGNVTQHSNDGGIDGIITTDVLGFDPIYIQAKRYALDKHVGRPEIQAFAGALGHTTRGIFITTSSFAKNAMDFAKTYPHATIVLIDGHKLAELMIQHNLAVSTEKTYQIKRIDIDYFEQG